MYQVIGICKDNRKVTHEYNDMCGAMRLWSMVSDDLSCVNVKTFDCCFVMHDNKIILEQTFMSRDTALIIMNELYNEYGELVSTDEINDFLGIELANKVTTAWKAYKLTERQGGFWVLA